MTRPGDWNPEVHAEEELCVCLCCDAHLHADAIGDECPRCGAPADEAFPHPANPRALSDGER